jgi:hypothetical protein
MDDIDWEKLWEKRMGLFLRAEMKKRNIDSKDLSNLLAITYGINQTSGAIDKKISRGSFSAVFFIQSLKVIGYEKCDIDISFNRDINAV